jgi:hypothetical protein
VFEYLDLSAVWRSIRSLLRPGAVVGTVVQLPTPGFDAITRSAYSSVQALAPSMRLVSPVELRDSARGRGADELRSYSVMSRAGKQFRVQVFRSNAMTDASGNGVR